MLSIEVFFTLTSSYLLRYKKNWYQECNAVYEAIKNCSELQVHDIDMSTPYARLSKLVDTSGITRTPAFRTPSSMEIRSLKERSIATPHSRLFGKSSGRRVVPKIE